MPTKPNAIMSESDKQRIKERQVLFRISRIYVLFVIAVFPLYVGPEGYDNIVFRKAQLYWIVSIIFFLVFSLFYLAYILGRKKTVGEPPFWKTLGISDYALIAFLLITTLSCVFSPYRNQVLLGTFNRNDGWLTYFCMIIGFFIISRYYKPQNLDFIIFAVSASLICIIGFLQYYDHDIFNLFPYYGAAYSRDGMPYYSGVTLFFRSTLGNTNFVGAYVCLTTILFGILYIKRKSYLRFLYLTTAVMNFILLELAHSRAGQVGILSAFLLLLPYWLTSSKSMGRLLTLVSLFGFSYSIHYLILIHFVFPSWGDGRPLLDAGFKADFVSPPLTLILIVSTVFLAIGLFFAFFPFKSWLKLKHAQIFGIALIAAVVIGGLGGIEIIGQKLPESNMIHQAREIMHGKYDDNFGSGRVFIWRSALAKAPQNSLLGTGTDTFYYALGKENQDYGSATYGVVFDKAHNDFVQILLCNGPFALLAYLAFVIGIITLSIKKAFNNTFLLAVFGSSLSYIIQSFFGIDTVIATPIFWTIVAIARNLQLAES